jgi:hypothetical protein
MTRIIEDIEAHYETHEVPFGRSYKWHPEHINVECDCGERLTLTATSAKTTCRCGTHHGASEGVRNIKKHDLGRLPDKIMHPWHHDAQEQAQQHQQDEAAYSEDSPWRYEDVTSGLMGDDEERWKKGRAQPG